MKIYELKSNSKYLNDYINLRNSFIKELDTKTVTVSQTINWLNSYNIKVLIAVQDAKLIGCVIIHIYRDGEITIFTKNKRTGLGSLLLKKVVSLARKKGLSKIWAWTLIENINANFLFMKNGFEFDKDIYKNNNLIGKKYIKKLNE